MPLVHVYLRKGRHEERSAAIGDAIHRALVSQANVPADDRFQIVHHLEAEDIVADPRYGGADRTESLVIIQIFLNTGRTVEIKKNLYGEIARQLEMLGIRQDDVMISLVEVAKENWSFGGGRATYA